MKKYFGDTSFLVGYSNDRDKFHQLAINKMKEIEKEESIIIFTSDYVVDEFLNIVLKLFGVKEAINWGKILFSKEFVDIIYSNETIISSA